jgi:hypothetical protein
MAYLKPVRQAWEGYIMSQDTLGSAAAIGTFVVIAATATAAIIQLRHLRQSNQLDALLTILRMPYGPVLHDAFEFIDSELPGRSNDSNFMQLLDASPINRKIHKELWVLDSTSATAGVTSRLP